MKKWLCRGVYFAPAVLFTVIMLFLGFYVVKSTLFFLLVALCWISGVLLSRNYVFGGVLALIYPIALYGETSMILDMNIVIMFFALYYSLCGLVVYLNDKSINLLVSLKKTTPILLGAVVIVASSFVAIDIIDDIDTQPPVITENIID